MPNNNQPIIDQEHVQYHLNFSSKEKLDNFRFEDIENMVRERKLKHAFNKLQYLNKRGITI